MRTVPTVARHLALVLAALGTLLAVMVGVVGTPVPSGATTPQTGLAPGQALGAGATLFSPAGVDWLSITATGNLVLQSPHAIVWQTKTAGSDARVLVMQGDGNLVLYKGHQAVWASGTVGNPGSSLSMSDTGLLRLTSPGGVLLWDSATGLTGYQMSGLGENQSLVPGESLVSPGGTGHVTFEADGNVVATNGSGATTWSSNTPGSSASLFVMQSDGNLVLYGPRAPLWNAGTQGTPGNRAVVTDAGILEVINPQGRVVWPTASVTLPHAIASLAESQDQNGAKVTEVPAGSGSNCNVYTDYFGRGAATWGSRATKCAAGTRSEAWCSDFAEWVWLKAGASITAIDGLSYSFIDQGLADGTYSPTSANDPQVGDAVVFGIAATAKQTGYGSHVGIVVGVKPGMIDMVSGNWGDGVIDTGWISTAGSNNGSGYPIIGYVAPTPASSPAAARAAAAVRAMPTLAQINSQDKVH